MNGAGSSPSEKASGTCDGIGFSRESTCCKDHAYQKCPFGNGCVNYNQGGVLSLNWWQNNLISFSYFLDIIIYS